MIPPSRTAPGREATIIISHPPAGRVSDICLLGDFKRIVDFDAKVANGILQLVLAKTDLLVLDDLGAGTLTNEHQRDLLEILEDRYALHCTLITSQFSVDHWHETIGDPTLADAILDRLVHNAYKLELKGESMRKRKKKLTQTDQSES